MLLYLYFLITLAEACPLDIWGQIATKAVEDALEGDAAARAWLSKYLLGTGEDLPTLSGAELAEQLDIGGFQL